MRYICLLFLSVFIGFSTVQAAPTTHFAIQLLSSEGVFQPKECSPVGLWVALSVLAKASQGKTQKELLPLLEERANVESIEKTLSYLARLTDVKLSLGLFACEKVQWKKPCVQSLQKFYRTLHIAPCQFHAPKEALFQINRWVQTATKGEIEEILHEEDIDSETVACLMSVLYFARTWEHPFREKDSTFRPFTIEANTLPVCTMHEVSRMRYASCPFGEYIEKPLLRGSDGGDYVVECFLPSRELTAQELESALLLSRECATGRRVSLFLPKSKGHSMYTWNTYLMRHGISTLFSNRADFSPLAFPSLAVQKIKEGTTISLSESGVVVADVVATSFSATSMLDPEMVVQVSFNRPFFFFVREKKSDMVLACSYIGAYAQLCTRKFFL